MPSSYANLFETVMEASEAKDWENAVKEWEIVDCEEDEELTGICICGKEQLRYLYVIRNRVNDNLLAPIGSRCIRKFERADLNDQTTLQEQMFRLLHALRDRKYITLDSAFFSRKLLFRLHEEGAFPSNEYNHQNGRLDYQFLLDMFNKRDKDSISASQQRKINGIIAYSIKPFLEKKLQGKVRQQ